jgi:hypothetical protein
MYARRTIAGLIILIGVPVLFAILWLVSGHGVFTKSGEATEVVVRDPLFGDTLTETRFVRGPIFGYYVGLDLLLLSVVAALIAAAIWWLLARRRRRRADSAKETPA